MAKIHTIRRRIKAVGNVRQITRAMEMVAASKLRRAQEATLRSRPYAVAAAAALARLRTLGGNQHPLFDRRPVVKSRLLIVFTSDRGLAGAYNANVVKQLLSAVSADGPRVQLVVIGERGAQFARKLTGDAVELIGVYTQWPVQPTSADVRPIAKTAIDGFLRGDFDQVQLLYTDFVSIMKQAVVWRDLLPVLPQALEAAVAGDLPDYVVFEPSPQAVLAYVVPRLVELQIYQAALEASASEQALRLVAMKSASDNARDLIQDMTLVYNGARQARITQELAEITAGAAAIT